MALNGFALLVAEARAWLEDCGMPAERAQGLTELGVIRAMHLNCEGGWRGWVATDQTLDYNTVGDELEAKHGSEIRDLYMPADYELTD